MHPSWNSHRHLAAWSFFGCFVASLAFTYATMTYCVGADLAMDCLLFTIEEYPTQSFLPYIPAVPPELGLGLAHVSRVLVAVWVQVLVGTAVCGIVALAMPSLPRHHGPGWHDDAVDHLRRNRGTKGSQRAGLRLSQQRVWRLFWLFALATMLACAWLSHSTVRGLLTCWPGVEAAANACASPIVTCDASMVLELLSNAAISTRSWVAFSISALAAYLACLVWPRRA